MSDERGEPQASTTATDPLPSDPGDILPPAPAWRLLPGLPIFAVSSFLAFSLMANERHLRGGVALGAILCVVAALALLDVLGGFEPMPNVTETNASPRVGSHLVWTVFGLGGFIAVTRLAVTGSLPKPLLLAGLLIPGLLIFTLHSLYRLVGALGVFGHADGQSVRHPSFWLMALTIAVYTPMLGSFSLIDPWETHYGEVAREILVRDDWISLWWAQDGWFWSKPILDFWLQALSFSLFDVNVMPDGMLRALAQGRTPYPEWAARLPMLLCSLVGQIALYVGVKRWWGRRAAFLGSVLLLAVPHYAIIVHQSMTDLPYIATLMAAMGLLLLGLFCPPEQTASGYAIQVGRRRLLLSAHTLVIGAIVLFALPQILYLASRNLGLATSGNDLGFFPHLDRFLSGSGGGNCGLPGNEACSHQSPVNSSPQPAASAAFWTVILTVFLLMNRGERRCQRLYFMGAWLMLALSFMAKGLPGPVIAIATFGAAVTVMGRWRDFEKFELTSALLILGVVALPWFVQMTLRHGPGFLERLFIHDMYKRAFVHVHDTNAGDDTSIRYYLWQLGYGLFPATGIVAASSLFGWFGRGEKRDCKQATATFLALWFLVGFAMFTLTLTKFHHYVIAVVPPACLLAGAFLSHTLGAYRTAPMAGWRGWLLPPPAPPPSRTEDRTGQWLIVLAAIAITWFVGVDLFTAGLPNGPVRLICLVSYNYSRIWPIHLHFEKVLYGVTLATIVATLGWFAPPRFRGYATALFLAVCLGFAAWVCNGYLPAIAPHWGQRDTIAEYYRRRHGPEELLVSYQMNWKGENFYTGNRTPVFITTGEPFKRFIEEKRREKLKILFLTLEHSRIGNLKADLGKVTKVDVLTDARLNNKFTLVRVEL